MKNVRLLALTSSVIPECKTAEELIVYAARVSNPSNQSNMDTASKLLAYCIKHAHWSIFETASMTVEVTTSRAIAAQLIRHRSFTFQEFSQRYAKAATFVKYGARRQDDKNRQNSLDDLDRGTKYWFERQQERVWEMSYSLYECALTLGIAKECARTLLPMSTQTTLYMTGSVRSWIHYLQTRTEKATQLEHRQIAQQIATIFDVQFPNIASALKEVSSL